MAFKHHVTTMDITSFINRCYSGTHLHKIRYIRQLRDTGATVPGNAGTITVGMLPS